MAAHAITTQLDGSCAGFGRRFWDLVAGRDLVTTLLRDRTVVEVVYEDRYLSTPLTLALLLEVLSELKHAAELAGRWRSPNIAILSMHRMRPPAMSGKPESGRPSDRYIDRWSSEWPLDALRDSALRPALDYSGLQGSVTSLPRRDLVHGRCLTIRCDRGRDVSVWLDQGLAYWSLDRRDAHGPMGCFPIDGELDDIVQQLASPTCTIQGQMLPTYVFVDGSL